MTENDHVSWAHADIEGSDLGDEKVVVDFRQGRYFGLNETGRYLFSLIQEPVAIETLVDAVAERYQIPRQDASGDVFAFVEAMQNHRLVTVQPAGAPA